MHLFGDAGQALRQYVQRFGDPTLDGAPAVLCADQAKAFERVSLAWLAAVLAGWGMPPWLRTCLLGLVCGRAVRSNAGGRLGPARLLQGHRHGWGGQSSPMELAFDP